jgi:hypothetical protein
LNLQGGRFASVSDLPPGKNLGAALGSLPEFIKSRRPSPIKNYPGKKNLGRGKNSCVRAFATAAARKNIRPAARFVRQRIRAGNRRPLAVS